MSTLPDISVVMPVYNAENYIQNTLDNLATQTFDNFEVLIINDWSTDRTEAILNDFTAKDHRFKLFNNGSKGVSSARNLGVSKSSGQFIIHHDADDFMPPEALEILYNEALKKNADVVIGDYLVKFEDGEKLEKHTFGNDPEKLISGLLHNKFHAGLWNKLIKKELYSGLSFDEDINYMEDKLLLIKIFLKKPIVSSIDKTVYHYIQYPDSITNSLTDKSLNSIKLVIQRLEDIFIKNNLHYDFTYLKIYYKLLAFLNGKKINFKAEFDEVNSKIMSNNDIALHHRILLTLKIYNFGVLSDLYLKIR